VLSDAELLAVLLKSGRRGASAIDLAREVLTAAGGLAGLAAVRSRRLCQPGVGRVKLAAILAAVELACRLSRAHFGDGELLARPSAVARYLWLRYGRHDQEVAGALYLTIRNRLIAERELFRGTLQMAKVEPRTVLTEALLNGAATVVLFHNHPSGDPTPSAEDLMFTRRMADAGEVVGVKLADHLIVGTGGRWCSLRERGAW
jgi:DNA repair protein RadC